MTPETELMHSRRTTKYVEATVATLRISQWKDDLIVTPSITSPASTDTYTAADKKTNSDTIALAIALETIASRYKATVDQKIFLFIVSPEFFDAVPNSTREVTLFLR
jgi:hypothetical protein